MNYKKGDYVRELASGKKGIVVGTKSDPFISTIDRSEQFPEDGADYIIMLWNGNDYSGIMHVYKLQLEILEN